MHITDKEKKAIYEAMKQIRENRRLQEQAGTKIKIDEIHGQAPPGARRQAQMRADRADRPSVLNTILNRTIDRGQDFLQTGTDAVGSVFNRVTGRTPEARLRRINSRIERIGSELDDINDRMGPGQQKVMGEQQSSTQSAPRSTPDGFDLGAELASRSRTAQKPPGVRRSSDTSNRRLERNPSSELQFSLAPPIRFNIYGNRIRQFRQIDKSDKELLGPKQYSTKTKKQIRENQKVTEDNKIFDRDIAMPLYVDSDAPSVYQGKNNDFYYLGDPAGLRTAGYESGDGTFYMSIDPLGPNVPAESGIFTPDSESYYSGTMGRGSPQGGRDQTKRMRRDLNPTRSERARDSVRDAAKGVGSSLRSAAGSAMRNIGTSVKDRIPDFGRLPGGRKLPPSIVGDPQRPSPIMGKGRTR